MMKLKTLLATFIRAAETLRSPILLALRVYFGWQLVQTGYGKFVHMENVVEFFASLGIPLPAANAHLVATVELVGGILLIAGLASRLAALPIAIAMTVAFLTADRDSLVAAISSPETFTSSGPFPFLLVALLVLAFGPGLVSIDALIAKLAKKNASRD